ncbi:MAG: hypothetical protein HUK22_01210, partial [Thermoguttaceae bacterium]|nr:hypothetical protein [Thermoguttaceae bacterium]
MFATFGALALLSVASAFGGERVVVIGDSITGHSMRLPYGFTHEIRKAFEDAGADVEFSPLGGSGQSIPSWRGLLKSSYTNDFQLDIPGIKVKTELDKGADVILVHLGMNDALCPAFKSSEEGFAAWKAECVALVGEIRERVPSAKRIILTSATMLTETPFGYKNLALDRLAELEREVAAETGCEYFDTRADFKKYFGNARMLDQTTLFTRDYVHPNEDGHRAMTYSFLTALGYKEIAEKYRAEKFSANMLDFDAPGLSLFVVPTDSPEKVVVKGRVRGAAKDSLKIDAPNGLKVDGIDDEAGDAFT